MDIRFVRAAQNGYLQPCRAQVWKGSGLGGGIVNICFGL